MFNCNENFLSWGICCRQENVKWNCASSCDHSKEMKTGLIDIPAPQQYAFLAEGDKSLHSVHRSEIDRGGLYSITERI